MTTHAIIETITISEDDLAFRLDQLLSKKFEGYSRTYFQTLIEKGHVLVNDKLCKKREKLSVNDSIKISFELPPETSVEPENIPLDILFEDEELLIVNKPPGMVVHPAQGNYQHTFVNALLYHCKNLPIDPEAPLRPGIVHRLDKDTSGVLVAAKTTASHRALVELFAQRKVKKRYKAICLNVPTLTEITAPIQRHPIKRQEMTTCSTGGKPAITQLEVITKNSQAALLDVYLITGRTHQIRVHLKHVGCPILGDSVYGSASNNQKWGIARQLLHAETLSFVHPKTGQEIYIKAPLPEDMQTWIKKLFPTFNPS